LRVVANSRTNNVRVVDRAEVPSAPFTPNHRRDWIYALIVGLATLTAAIPYAFCSLAGTLIAAGQRNLKALRVTPVEIIAFIFSLFVIYGCGPEAVLYGLMMLLVGLPVYVWQRHEHMKAVPPAAAVGAAGSIR
jgi:arginine:agmatine antiporter